MTDRWTLLGGTFDPIHNGHLAIIEQARDLLGAAAWLVVADHHSLRTAPAAPPEVRLHMAQVAVADREIAVTDVELRRGGVSYTIDTAEALARDHPGVEMSFVLGADAARTVQAWHRSADLLATARFVIVNRHGAARLDVGEARELGFSPERTRLLAVESPAISATDIRRRVAAGASIDEMVPPAVAAIIAERGLYGYRQDRADAIMGTG